MGDNLIEKIIPRGEKQGITFDEYRELLEYVQANNGWENMYLRLCKAKDEGKEKEFHKRPFIKYVTSSCDTREGRVWQVGFSGPCSEEHPRSEPYYFRSERGYDLKTEIYKWLNGGVFDEEKEKKTLY